MEDWKIIILVYCLLAFIFLVMSYIRQIRVDKIDAKEERLRKTTNNIKWTVSFLVLILGVMIYHLYSLGGVRNDYTIAIFALIGAIFYSVVTFK